MWEILKQNEIPHCPIADHWSNDNHDVDSCVFNTKSSRAGESRSSTSNSSNSNNNYYNKRPRGNYDQQTPHQTMMMPMAPSNMMMQPSASGMGMGMNVMPMAQQMPMQYGYHQQGFNARPRYPCGFMTPNGACQQTNHQAQNCPNNPQSRYAQGAFNNQQPATVSGTATHDEKEKGMHNVQHAHVEIVSVVPVSSCDRTKISQTITDPGTLDPGSNHARNEVPVLRELDPSSTRVQSETHQLPSTLSQPAPFVTTTR